MLQEYLSSDLQTPEIAPLESSDYSSVLKEYGLHYRPAEYYWQVGEMDKVQGWIIHLSVIKSQIEQLLHTILPLFTSSRVTFKIVRDSDTANMLLGGNFGSINLGKLISIYPNSDAEAEKLAVLLIEVTKSFKGPAIPTDAYLGSIVYTRYGSFKPVLLKAQDGSDVKMIYTIKGELVPDAYSIPFALPENIKWPYDSIASPMPPKTPTLLNYVYYPISILKPDAKGNIIKALYFKHFWQIKSCLIKQGRKGMVADAAGRDIQDRLKWQSDLYKALGKDLPIPKVFDYFSWNGDSYLAMEFINGVSFTKWMQALYVDKNWVDLPVKNKLAILDKLLEILGIINTLHEKGYIHRDVTPENFLITGKGAIYMIDMELTWCSKHTIPNPPFRLGTPGFISPEQSACSTPTIKEDIYALGAFMIMSFTNLPPLKFIDQNSSQLKNALLFFTHDIEIAEFLPQCLDLKADNRPNLDKIEGLIKKISIRLQQNRTLFSTASSYETHNEDTNNIIQSSLEGLGSALMTQKSKWFSKNLRNEFHLGNEQQDFSFYEGWHTGMAGPLWLLAKAKKNGYSIDSCLNVCTESLKFIKQALNKNQAQFNPGLFYGSAGIAQTIASCLDAEIITPEYDNIYLLEKCFSIKSDNLSIKAGISGQGIALLNSSHWLNTTTAKTLLDNYLDQIINLQQADGSWVMLSNYRNKQYVTTGFANGIAGIVWFLLSCMEKMSDIRLTNAVSKALSWLLKKADIHRNTYSWPILADTQLKDEIDWAIGSPGVTLAFIKAYAILKDEKYKQVAESSLQYINPRPVLCNFKLDNGLTGLGEIYFDAYEAFQNQEWMSRANWICNLFKATLQTVGAKSAFYIPETTRSVTADLFTGNSGIIHLLIRQQSKEQLKHPVSTTWT